MGWVAEDVRTAFIGCVAEVVRTARMGCVAEDVRTARMGCVAEDVRPACLDCVAEGAFTARMGWVSPKLFFPFLPPVFLSLCPRRFTGCTVLLLIESPQLSYMHRRVYRFPVSEKAVVPHKENVYGPDFTAVVCLLICMPAVFVVVQHFQK